jgi:putative transposase
MFKLFDPNSDFQIIAGSNLPHWFQPQATYFITFRTEDSLPREVVQQWYAKRSAWLAQHGISTSMPDWKDKLAELPEALRKKFHQTLSQQYMESLDKGLGACVLKRPRLAKIVVDNLFAHVKN